MAQIRVINNYTGDEGLVDETWLERWPDDFTALSDDHVPVAEQERRAAAEADTGSTPPPSDSAPKPVARKIQPSDGTNDKDN